jgi:Cytochrome c
MFVRTLGSLLRLCAFSGSMVGLCFAQEKQSQKTPDTSSALALGAELYKDHCVVCHGDDLKGNGPFPPPCRVSTDFITLSHRHTDKGSLRITAERRRQGTNRSCKTRIILNCKNSFNS